MGGSLMNTKKYVFGFVIFLSFILALPAFGHTSLIKTNPEGNTTIKLLPQRVSLDFDEELIDLGSGYELEVVDPNGNEVTTGEISINVANISRSLKPSSIPGTYTVSYRVVSNDGHVVKSEYSFNLAQQLAPTASASASPSTIAKPLSPSSQVEPEKVGLIQAEEPEHTEHTENFIVHHRTHIIWTLIAITAVVGLFFYRRSLKQ